MAREQLYINNTYIPLSTTINAALTKSITDIEDPSKRKSTFSKTTKIPLSKELKGVINAIYDVNGVDNGFDITVKADLLYLVDGEPILSGYCQIKTLTTKGLRNKDREVEVVMFGEIANIYRNMGENYIEDLDLSRWNHPFDKDVQADSWDTQVWDNDAGAFIPFALGQGYVYPLIDYGYSTDLDDFTIYQIPTAIYLKEYIDAIFAYTGFTYTSSFFNSTYFKSLIIPSSPETLSLTDAEIEAAQFSANTPIFTSTGTTTSNNLPLGNTYSTPDTIIFTNEISDPSGLYNNGNGKYTVTNSNVAGLHNINALIEIKATLTPSLSVPVRTTSNIDGSFSIWLNGVQVMATPFYLTVDDYAGPLTIGARSTTPSPTTYPDSDYPEGGSVFYSDVSISLVALLVPRLGQNTPNRYLLNLNGINLAVGDEIEIKWKARYRGLNNQNNHMFETAFNVGVPGNATIDVSVAAFYNNYVNTYTQEGNILDIQKAIPRNIKQKDFFNSVLKMFNLWMDTDPDNSQNYIIEPRENFLTGDTLDIQCKLDKDRGLKTTPMGKTNVSDYEFSYKQDKDYLNEKYETQWQRVYGDRQVINNNQFTQKVEKTKIIFSPTPLSAPANKERVLSTIVGPEGLGNPRTISHNIRILYYGGLKTGEPWNHINFLTGWPYIPNPTVRTQYPFAGHFDDPYNPTEDINFGLVKEVYYDDNIQPITVTNNNLVNKYYSNMIQEYTDKGSKIGTAWFNIHPSDFKTWDFRKLYWFENAYWRLQKIYNYNPTSSDFTKCDFLFLTDVPKFSSDGYLVLGSDDPEVPGGLGGGGGDFTEDRPAKGTKAAYQPDQNNTGKRGVQVEGKENFIATDSFYVDINGDRNQVYGGAENIKIHGDNNIIEAGVRDVVLLNSNGLTIEESNVTYINGIKVDSFTDHHSGFYKIEAPDTVTVEENKQMTNWNRLEIDGTLIIDGELILK